MTDPDLELLRALDPTLDDDEPDPADLTAAIRDFQQLAGLEPTGRWNQATGDAAEQTRAYADAVRELAADRPTLERGATGEHVSVLQRLIQAPLTGEFDADTERRVRRIQGANGMPQTGIADADVWAAVAP
jgi:peptidoglycan hydrolase-like protein with peptidoglycan-binding domain